MSRGKRPGDFLISAKWAHLTELADFKKNARPTYIFLTDNIMDGIVNHVVIA